MGKPSVVVHIAGQRYVIKSDAEESYILELGAYLDKAIREVQSTPRPAATQSQVILAALQITDELFQHRKSMDDLKQTVAERSRAVMEQIDQEVTRLKGN